MGFSNLWLLSGIIPFLLILLLLKKLEKRRYLEIPSVLIIKKVGTFKKFFKAIGRACWFFAAFFCVTALAGPYGTSETEKIKVEGRKMVLSIDLSTSMSGIDPSSGRPTVDVIKEHSLNFAQKRSSTDLVGITAYGGKSYGRNNGEAAAICFPTSENRQLSASIMLLRPGLLGAFTSIGEGIFVSILTLIEYDSLKEIDVQKLINSLDGDDKDYALSVVRKLGRFRNFVIILFTDGKNNAGIEPAKTLWLAKMLGIKVHFASLDSSNATGLMPEEQERQKALLVNGVRETGGKYFEMKVAEEAREFFDEIDKLETARLEFSSLKARKELTFFPVLLTLIFSAMAIILENIFPKIQ